MVSRKSMAGQIRERLPLIVVVAMVAAYAAIYGSVEVFRINHFDGQPGYDLAIPDQGIWLMSHFKSPYSTVRGLHLFGDHTPYIYIFLVPFYWLWDSINTLLILHSLALGIGGLGVYLIAAEAFADYPSGKRPRKGARISDATARWAPVVLAFAYLMYPALNYLNMDILFSESFAVPLLIFAYYFALKGRNSLFMLLSALALLCKEDTAVTVFFMGLYVAWRHDRRSGAIVCAAAAAWFALDMSVLLKYFNGFGYFRNLYGYAALGRLGRGPGEAASIIASNPRILVDILVTGDNGQYLLDVFTPLLLIPFFRLDLLAVALPALGINLLSGYYYTHFIKYHYTAHFIPFLIISTVYGMRYVCRLKIVTRRMQIRLAWLFLILLTVSVLYSDYSRGGDFNIVKNPRNVYTAVTSVNTYTANHVAMWSAVSKLPANASVSASYDLLPHLAHREKIYMFHSPFKPAYWGINGENLPTEKPEYLLLDMPLVGGETKGVLDGLLGNGTYFEIGRVGNIITYGRNVSVGG